MITEYILSVPAFLVQGIITLLPASTGIQSEWVNALYTMWNYVNAFSFIIPVATFVFCIGTLMTYYLIVYGWDALNWILRKIPGVN